MPEGARNGVIRARLPVISQCSTKKALFPATQRAAVCVTAAHRRAVGRRRVLPVKAGLLPDAAQPGVADAHSAEARSADTVRSVAAYRRLPCSHQQVGLAAPSETPRNPSSVSLAELHLHFY